MRSVIITLLIGSSLLFAQKPTGGGGGSAGGGAPSPSPPTGAIQINAGSGMFGALGAVIPTSTMGLTAGDTGDNGPIFNAAIAAATGDTEFFCDTPGATYRVTTQIVFPAYTSTPFPTHYNFRFTGVGNYFPWQSNGALANGCTIDLEYTGYGGGAIYGSAYGGLEWDHWTIAAFHSPATYWTIGSNLTSIVISGTYPNQIGTVTVTTPTQTLNAGNYVQILGATVNASLNTTYPVTSNSSGTVFVIGTIPYGISNGTYTDAGMSINYTPAMFYLTNTEPIFHDLYVIGDSSLGLANNQDFVVLGGNSTSNNSTANSAFGGYGGSIKNISLDYVRRYLYLRGLAQQLFFENFYGNPVTVGSNDPVSGAAIEEGYEGGNNTYVAMVPGGRYVSGFLVDSNASGGSTIIGTQGADHCCAGKTMYNINSPNNPTMITGIKSQGTLGGSGAAFAVLADGQLPALLTGGGNNQPIAIGQLQISTTTGYPGLYASGVTPSNSNYVILTSTDGNSGYVNGGTDLYMQIGGTTIGHLTSSAFSMPGVPSTLSIATGTIASPPATPHTGQLVYFTDAATVADCTVGMGSAHSMCAWNGAAWAKP